ncbi:14033_t:CDS:2 [Acaulospora colombiana]|uniref:14033_t:CDS:1 n=1 Tax=Acaulospora colombiana TaxID=27376 RepID=A0ACA9KSL1_9GLOM|nr:14033_t:CDS:2 [Acaulospora colombiana]
MNVQQMVSLAIEVKWPSVSRPLTLEITPWHPPLPTQTTCSVSPLKDTVGTREVGNECATSFPIIIAGTEDVERFDFVDLTDDTDGARLRNDFDGVGAKLLSVDNGADEKPES